MKTFLFFWKSMLMLFFTIRGLRSSNSNRTFTRETGMRQPQWTDETTTASGVRERGFTVERGGRAIPGVLWQPTAASGRRPLVLMGHGGTGHKRDERMTLLGRLFAGEYG